MASSKVVTWMPARGRGLTTAYSSDSLGELWNSFSIFRNVIIQNGAWVCRPGDRLFFTNNGQVQTIHPFNLIGSDGTITTQLIWIDDAGIMNATAFLGTPLETCSAPFEVFFETVKNRVFFAGANNAPKIYNGLTATLSQWGAAGPTGDLTYVGFKATSASSSTAASVVTVVNGSPTVNWSSGTTFTTGSTWVGKTITLDGVDYVIQAVAGIHQLTLAINYAGSSATVNAYAHYGNRSWSTPPKYAIAYYNPTTGHITNTGNTLALSEKDINNVSVFIGGITTNATLASYGYTKIVLFRTAKDGSVLFPLKLTPGGIVDSDGFINNTGGPLSYKDDDGQDNNLGAILGLNEAPTLNDPAPDMRIIAYADGRFWGIETARPWRVRFSASAVDIALGVAEECWPEEFFRDVKSADGAATSIKVIGSTLILGTLRYMYFLVGSDPGSYDFQRISSRGPGVNQYAIDEHPGDGSVASASAIYVSSDRQAWRHIEGGAIRNLGQVIQDKLDAVLDLSGRKPFFVKVFRLKKLWVAAVGILNSKSPMSFAALGNGSGHMHVVNGSPFADWVDGSYFDPSWNGQTIVIDGVNYTVLTVLAPTGMQLSGNYSGTTSSSAPFTVGAGGGGGGDGGDGLDYSVFFYDFDQECWYDWGFSNIPGSPNGLPAWCFADIVYQGYGENRVLVSVNNGGPQGVINALFEGTTHPDGGESAEIATQHWDAGDRDAKKSFSEFRLYVSDAAPNYNVFVEYDEQGIQYPLTIIDKSNTPGYLGRTRIRYVDRSSKMPQFHSVRFFWQIPTIGLKVFKAQMLVSPQSTGEAGEPT